ncbi:MAG: PatB family C-S lyase [Bacteroidota bacterium]|nr:PatB family C-S lyase [Bacteroidota bacterium]
MNYSFDEIVDREGTACVKWDLRDKVFGNADVLPMWVADMDFKTPGFITDAIIKRAQHPVYGYSFRTEGYYSSIINWIQVQHGWSIERDWILFSPGVVPVLFMAALAFTNPGDKILIQTPVYPPFYDAVLKNNRKLVFNPLILKDNRYEIDFEDLDQKLDGTRMMIISNPHNPVGRVWTKDELLEIGRLCLKHKVVLISDEIHCDLVFSAYKHIPTASLSPEIADITVTCVAASKTFNTAGLSTSNVIISNPELRSRLENTILSVHVDSGNLFGSIATEAAYTYGREWHKQLIDYLEKNVNLVRSFLKEKLPAIRLIEPEATYLLWLDFRELGLSQSDLVKLLINKGRLGFNDGAAFGKEGYGFMRVNVGCPRSMLLDGLQRLEHALNE